MSIWWGTGRHRWRHRITNGIPFASPVFLFRILSLPSNRKYLSCNEGFILSGCVGSFLSSGYGGWMVVVWPCRVASRKARHSFGSKNCTHWHCAYEWSVLRRSLSESLVGAAGDVDDQNNSLEASTVLGDVKFFKDKLNPPLLIRVLNLIALWGCYLPFLVVTCPSFLPPNYSL